MEMHLNIICDNITKGDEHLKKGKTNNKQTNNNKKTLEFSDRLLVWALSLRMFSYVSVLKKLWKGKCSCWNVYHPCTCTKLSKMQPQVFYKWNVLRPLYIVDTTYQLWKYILRTAKYILSYPIFHFCFSLFLFCAGIDYIIIIVIIVFIFICYHW